ncbi:galactokinase [Sphingorhabdus arenilitoris]|uniref:Galactokinase n=1 Tax=Sphingorhabdus arenilitoris TaxID=1490041 RepID=A0ABV8RCG4_9SPHN
MMTPEKSARNAFHLMTGQPPEICVRAPGRVNLIGEHTDYNDGFVLPCAIGRETVVAASRRSDQTVRVIAADFGDVQDQFAIDQTIEALPGSAWQNYVRGMVKIMRDAGHGIGGTDIAISGNIPLGSGLSSSASLEVALGTMMQHLWVLPGLDPAQIALLGQKAENDFVGCQCGIMDQMISAAGQAGHALAIDCRSLALSPVPIPDDLAIIIAQSGITHDNVGGHYNDRRRQCEEAARMLDVAALRDADMPMLEAKRGQMDDVVYRRARHIVTENQRTFDMARALAEADIQAMSMLMAESHSSMRDDFEITVPGIDRLAEIMQRAAGKYGGARMTGGGFGGAAVALVRADQAEAVCASVREHYTTPAGTPPEIMVEKAAAGASLCP